MDVQRCSSPREFLDATLELRSREPARSNVIGSVAMSVESGERNYDECFWWVLRDGVDVVGLAMHTGSHPMSLGPMPIDAAYALGVEVAAADGTVSAVNGSEPLVNSLVEGMRSTGVSVETRVQRRELLQSLEELFEPDVPGEMRPATEDDIELVLAWFALFATEVDLTPSPPEAIFEIVNAGRLFLWTRDDTVVSMAGHAVVVPTPSGTVARIGPVFTPMHRRGHGYAAAVTAGVSELLITEGAHVVLYTDKDNATSNGVYRRLGYHVIDEIVGVELVGKGYRR